MDSALRIPARADFRIQAFLLAIAIYALAGSPTPDAIGPAEIIVGALLVIAVAGQGGAIILRPPRQPWGRPAWLMMFYGLSVPVFVGLLAGNAPGAMLRDIIPFLFFLLPLFMFPVLEKRHFAPVLWVAVFAGVAFGARVMLPVALNAGGMGWKLAPPADPFYLANAPTVLFAALYLTGLAGVLLYRKKADLLRAALCGAAAFMPLVAMALVAQRASMGAFCIFIAALSLIAVARAPARALRPLFVAACIAALAYPLLAAFAAHLVEKTALVGVNMRWQEARAVFAQIDPSFGTVLFGRGWGAHFASPAVGGVTVNFTHSLLTSFWLKTGLPGLGLALWYLAALCLVAGRLVFRNPALGMALGAPLAIDMFLYASFKSLDFGLILLLISLAGKADESLKPTPPV